MIDGLIDKLKKLYKIDYYFYQPHTEYSYYLVKRTKLTLKEILNSIDNSNYKKVVTNRSEDIYYINESNIDIDNFESIRIRTYKSGDYEYSANLIFALKNNKGKEEIFVTVHKNILNIEEFVEKISCQLSKYFNVTKRFYIEKDKIVFFIKDFKFEKNKIKEDYISFSFEEILNIYDENHNKVEKKIFKSNFILEIEFAGIENMQYAKKLKRSLCYKLKSNFHLLSKKNRKSYEIVKSFLN